MAIVDITQNYGHCKNVASGPFIVRVSVFMVWDELYTIEQLNNWINALWPQPVYFWMEAVTATYNLLVQMRCCASLYFMQCVDFCHIISYLCSVKATSIGLFALAAFYIFTKFSHYVLFRSRFKKIIMYPKAQQKGPTQVGFIRNRRGFLTFWCEKTHMPCISASLPNQHLAKILHLQRIISDFSAIYFLNPTNSQYNCANRKMSVFITLKSVLQFTLDTIFSSSFGYLIPPI